MQTEFKTKTDQSTAADAKVQGALTKVLPKDSSFAAQSFDERCPPLHTKVVVSLDGSSQHLDADDDVDDKAMARAAREAERRVDEVQKQYAAQLSAQRQQAAEELVEKIAPTRAKREEAQVAPNRVGLRDGDKKKLAPGACYQCHELGHNKKHCPELTSSAGHGKRQGGRDRAIAESVVRTTQEQQGALDASKSLVAQLREELAALNAKPAEPALRDLPLPNKLLSERHLTFIDKFQSDPTPLRDQSREEMALKFALWVAPLGTYSVTRAVNQASVLSRLSTTMKKIVGFAPPTWRQTYGSIVGTVALILAVMEYRRRVHARWRPRVVYTRLSAVEHELESEEDNRGMLNRATKMLYGDPRYSIWQIAKYTAPEGRVEQLATWAGLMPERVEYTTVMVSDVLVGALLSPAVSTNSKDPAYVYDKMKNIASTQGQINISSALQAERDVGSSSVNLAFAYLYGYRYQSDQHVMPHAAPDPGKAWVPVRY